ncbi:MAG: prolyl-tRNA synthetase associated domain-containing protein [Lachnospiraceae bacterium]|nr:prolyl-tRNA synthetase associated domain-containing protein [Lachnospiraceae bacterium]
MNIYKGRPDDISGRLEKEIRIYDLLDGLSIEYERVDHEAAETMEACQDIDEALGMMICKNLFLRNTQKTRFYLLCMPGDKKFKTKDLSAQINSARLSFAEPEFMEKYLDILPGSVSIMGLANDKLGQVQLIIDEDLMTEKSWGCHPCVNTSTIKLATSDVIDVFLKHIGHEPIYVRL